MLALHAPLSRTLSDQVADQLRSAILGGRLKPGQRLVEQEIAEEMQLSRGPVRDALRILETEHLVVRTPHRGTFVTWLTRQDVDEIYSFREILELLALRYALKRVTESQLDELEQLVNVMADQARSEYSQFDATDLDLQFHHMLCRISGHGRLLTAWEALQAQVRLLILTHRVLQPSDFREKGVEWHRRLVSVLRARDLPRAEEILRTHINASYETVVAAMENLHQV